MLVGVFLHGDYKIIALSAYAAAQNYCLRTENVYKVGKSFSEICDIVVYYFFCGGVARFVIIYISIDFSMLADRIGEIPKWL